MQWGVAGGGGVVQTEGKEKSVFCRLAFSAYLASWWAEDAPPQLPSSQIIDGTIENTCFSWLRLQNPNRGNNWWGLDLGYVLALTNFGQELSAVPECLWTIGDRRINF